MSKRYTLLLSLILVLFLIFYFLLCYYSRLATDDYYFIYDVRTTSILEGVYSQYMGWCGRYTARLAADIPYKLFDVDQTYYFLLPLISFISLLAGLYIAFRAFGKRLNFNFRAAHLVIASTSFSVLLFFMSYQIGETWFWYCSLSSYLWSIIAFIWGIAFLTGIKNQIMSILFSSICFIYIGGSSEVYSVIYGLLILLFFMFRYKQSSSFNFFISDPLNFRLMITCLIFGISFLIFLVAPGNYLRDHFFPERHFFNSLFIILKAAVKFCGLFIPPRLVYILAFGIPFAVIGTFYVDSQTDRISFNRLLKIATVILLSLLLLFFIIVAFVMVETGPPRIWFVLSFLISAYTAIICFYAGYSGYITEKKISILKKGSIVLGFLIVIYCFTKQLPVVITYSKGFDERIHYITDLNHKIQDDTVIILKPLPPSGMLYSSEITPDTNHFTNKEMQLGYDLKFHVIINKQ